MAQTCIIFCRGADGDGKGTAIPSAIAERANRIVSSIVAASLRAAGSRCK